MPIQLKNYIIISKYNIIMIEKIKLKYKTIF
jgi:hypothetical protein